MRLAISILILTALLIQYIQVGFEAYAEPLYSVEVYGAVVRVIDGDTLDLRVLAVYKDRHLSFNGSTIRVRLADINAPELDTPEGEEAKRALNSLVSGKNIYLDIDDLYIYDRYGRVVAIAYLPINSTHLLNINLWLVLNGYAEIVDYPNEFSPSRWSLYIVLNQTTTAIATTTQETITIVMPITIYTTVEKISTKTITIEPQEITLYRTLHSTLIKTADQISEKTVIITRIDTTTKTISNPDIGSLAAAILVSLAIGFVIGYITLGSMRRGRG